MKLAEFDTRNATMGRMLSEKGRRLGSKVFLTHLPDGRTFTYGQIDELTRRIGNGLLGIGIPFGGHVAVLMENCPEQVLAQWGICRAGMVTVPINIGAKGHLLSYFLTHADCVAVIVERALLDRIEEVASLVPKLRHVIVAEIPRAGTPTTHDRSQPRDTRFIDFNVLLSAPDTVPQQEPSFMDTAILMYTSGTTGPSKANIFCHAQLIYYGLDVATHHEYVPEDIAYVYLPLFHGNAPFSAALHADRFAMADTGDRGGDTLLHNPFLVGRSQEQCDVVQRLYLSWRRELPTGMSRLHRTTATTRSGASISPRCPARRANSRNASV